MAPFPKLESLVLAARRERSRILETIASNPSANASMAITAMIDALLHNVAHGGDFDCQRQANKRQKGGYVQLRQFRNISNVNVGRGLRLRLFR